MLKISVILCFFVAPALAAASDVLYNHIGTRRTSLDDLVHEYFANIRPVVDIGEGNPRYLDPKRVKPQSKSASEPDEHHCVPGIILIVYVIERDGSVAFPFVARSSDPELSRMALARVEKFLFEPAKLDGQPVASIANTGYRFTCPSPGDEPEPQ